MHRYFMLFIVLCGTTSLLAQDLAIGQWRMHLPYRFGVSVAHTPQRAFCATENALFSLSKSDHTLRAFTKVNGLSGVGLRHVAYTPAHDMLLITYDNANIDILHKNRFIHVPDIAQSDIVGSKNINDIYFKESDAMLSCDFGIVVYDLEALETRDTWFIGQQGDLIGVYGTATDANYIYAATAEGLKRAPLDASDLAHFAHWELLGPAENLPDRPADLLKAVENRIFCVFGDSLYAKTDTGWAHIHYEEDWEIEAIDPGKEVLYMTQYYSPEGSVNGRRIMQIDKNDFTMNVLPEAKKVIRPRQVSEDADSVLWIADFGRGLIRFEAGKTASFSLNGPETTNAFSLTTYEKQVWATAGAYDDAWTATFNPHGFYGLLGGAWYTYNLFSYSALSSVYDYVTAVVNPHDGTRILGAYYGGVVFFEDENNITVYNESNSSLQGAIGDEGRVSVAGMDVDENNNLWVSNYGAPNPMSVRLADGTWKAFSPDITSQDNAFGQIVIDDHDQKWVVLPRGNGLMVFDHGEVPEETSDYTFVKLREGEGNGNLPHMEVLSLAKDRRGDIWVGTAEGIVIFFCTGSVLTENGCDGQRILVQRDGYNAYLLEDEHVEAIAVDGANRKWVGTTNGVFLLSADGREEIHHFTEANSPLLDNQIFDVAVNDHSGEVFFATAKGLCSFKSTATGGEDTHQDVYAYPNPVRANYHGPIAIKGLVMDADVKITDISGQLVYHTTAHGGQAIWDGTGPDGQRVHTGVYLVFSTNADGSETIVTKVLVMN